MVPTNAATGAVVLAVSESFQKTVTQKKPGMLNTTVVPLTVKGLFGYVNVRDHAEEAEMPPAPGLLVKLGVPRGEAAAIFSVI